MQVQTPLEKFSRPQAYNGRIYIKRDTNFLSDELGTWFRWEIKHAEQRGDWYCIFDELCVIDSRTLTCIEYAALTREIVLQFWQDELVKQRRAKCTDIYKELILIDSERLFYSLLDTDGLPYGLTLQIVHSASVLAE